MRLSTRSTLLWGAVCAVLAITGCNEQEPPPPLTIWHSLPSQEARELTALADPLAEKHPEWQLSLKAIQTDSIVNKLGSPEGPDAALVPLAVLPRLIRDQQVLPMGAHLSERDRLDILPAAWKEVAANNQPWGIPLELSCQALLFRKSAFTSDAVSVPATLSDLEAKGETFHRLNPQVAFLSLPTDPATLEPMLWAFGGTMAQDEAWKTTTQFLLNLRSRQVLGPFHQTSASCIDVLESGRTAMAFGTPEHLKQLTSLTSKDDLGLAPLPGNVPTPLTGRVWVVSPKAARMEAALAAVKALSDTETAAKWNASLSRIPARMSAYDDPLIRQRPLLAGYRELLNHTRTLSASDLEATAAMAPEWRPYLIGLKTLEMPKPPVAPEGSPSPAAKQPAAGRR